MMNKTLDELYITYKRARVAIKENMPSTSELLELKNKLEKAATDLKSAKITTGDYEKIAKDMRDLDVAMKRSESFIHALIAAVDPNRLAEILCNLHVYLLSITAVAASTTAATITVGLNIGRVISERTYYVILELRKRYGKDSLENKPAETAVPAEAAATSDLRKLNPPLTPTTTTTTSTTSTQLTRTNDQDGTVSNEEWLRSAIKFIGNSIGLSIAYAMQKTSIAFGGCVMGSEYIISAFEDLVDPFLEKNKLPSLRSNASAKVAVQSTLVAIGFLSQLRGGSRGFGFVKTFMSPLYITEAAVQAYLFSSILKKNQ
jgi:hypothetical protein